jgi:hypothetical protein
MLGTTLTALSHFGFALFADGFWAALLLRLLAGIPGTRGYTKAIVAAQMLAQIGAFALPALLPDYIARWNLSKTEAGWLVGIFFAAYLGGKRAGLGLGVRPSRPDHADGAGLSCTASAQEPRRCKAWLRALPRKLTAARCSGAGKRSPRHRPGRRARKCRS